ncbi:MAG: hypothetical protein AB1Z98_23000 [Nannocystaceae bacterium]
MAPACVDDPDPRATIPLLRVGPEDEGLVLAERAYLVEDDVEVMDDALLLSPLAPTPDGGWQADDLLVSGRGAGFLRRVVDVEERNHVTVVQTENADLSELVAYGGLHTSMRPFAEDLRLDDATDLGGLSGRSAVLDGFDLRDSLDARREGRPGLEVVFPTTVLAQAPGFELTLQGGHFSFDPTLDLDLDLGLFRIDRFEVLAAGTMDAEVELMLATDGEHQVSNHVQLWQSPRYAWNGSIGPVPVVIVTRLTLDATVEAGTSGPSIMTMGAGAGSYVELGAVYEDGPQDGWTVKGDHRLEAHLKGPELVIETALDVQVRLDGTLDVELYEVIGPSLTLSPWTGLHVDDAQRLTVDVGVDAVLGGSIGPFALDEPLLAWEHRALEGPL